MNKTKPYVLGYYHFPVYEWEKLIDTIQNSHRVAYGRYHGIEISKEDALFLKLSDTQNLEFVEGDHMILLCSYDSDHSGAILPIVEKYV